MGYQDEEVNGILPGTARTACRYGHGPHGTWRPLSPEASGLGLSLSLPLPLNRLVHFWLWTGRSSQALDCLHELPSWLALLGSKQTAPVLSPARDESPSGALSLRSLKLHPS